MGGHRVQLGRRLIAGAVVFAFVSASCSRVDPDAPASPVVATPGVVSPSVVTPDHPCPVDTPDCLAWDDFAAIDGSLVRAPSGQPWVALGLSCSDCHPTFEAHHGRAFLGATAQHNSTWFATVDTAQAAGIAVSATIRLSPTLDRANAGLVALFTDRENHLVCKIEVTEGNPDGLIAIGDERNGVQASLLSYRREIGLRNGVKYRLEMTIPERPERRPVRCTVSRPGIRQRSAAYRLPADALAAYGAGTSQGLRIKIFEDEDDGGSSWDDFLVAPA